MNVPAQGDLRRVIGFWGGTALIIGVTIGSGIFRKPATLAGLIPSPTLILGLWAAFGIISICGALALAELSSMMPKTGGVYVYLRAAYGDSAAFVFGWIYLLVATPATVGALATFFAELFCVVFLKKDYSYIPLIAGGTLGALAIANLVGAALGTWIGNVFTAIKLGALLMLAFVAFFMIDGSFGHLAAQPGSQIQGAKLGQAIASVIWAYDGWVAVSMITGEVVAAEKLMKRIIIAGMLTIVGIYVLANVSYFYAMSLPEMAATTIGVPQQIMDKVTGNGGKIIGFCIMCSVFGALNGNVMTKPRVSYALSRDRLTFEFLGRAHPRWGTPYAAILIQTVVAIAMVVLLRDANDPGRLFDKLTTYFVVVEWTALLFTVGAVMVLRRRMPDAERPFRAPGYPVVPLVFLLGTGAGLAAITWGEWVIGNRTPIYGLLLSAIGFPVYYLWRRISPGSGPAQPAPEAPPQ